MPKEVDPAEQARQEQAAKDAQALIDAQEAIRAANEKAAEQARRAGEQPR